MSRSTFVELNGRFVPLISMRTEPPWVDVMREVLTGDPFTYVHLPSASESIGEHRNSVVMSADVEAKLVYWFCRSLASSVGCTLSHHLLVNTGGV